MIVRLIDKLVFGGALIFALQVPQLADHYQQFLSGLYESTKWQVDKYQENAVQHEYSSVEAMIEHHLQNDVPSVRSDAEQKLATIDLYKKLENAISIFQNGNILNKTIYMFNPSRVGYLRKTIVNFKLGIPLTLSGLTFGVITGLILNYIITLPFILLARRKKRVRDRITY